MGAVYEALHAELGRRVAVKVLRPEFSADRVAAERFRAEARTASELRHRNVVEVTDFGDDGGRLYLVMELLEGESLQALLDREGPLDEDVALKLVDPVLSALAWAHARGVVHRDVKPDNVFLARIPGESEPVAKLLDFGIARGARADGVKLTQTGVMLGTPAYMAPEQAWNSAPLTPAADQWSAAAMLYEMLSGRIPHQCDALSELVARRVSQDPDDLASLRPSLSPKLCAVVMRALSRDVSARFPSIEDFAEALRDTASDAVAPSLVTAPPITAPPRAPGLDATAEAPLAPVDPPHPEPPPEEPPPDAPPARAADRADRERPGRRARAASAAARVAPLRRDARCDVCDRGDGLRAPSHGVAAHAARDAYAGDARRIDRRGGVHGPRHARERAHHG